MPLTRRPEWPGPWQDTNRAPQLRFHCKSALKSIALHFGQITELTSWYVPFGQGEAAKVKKSLLDTKGDISDSDIFTSLCDKTHIRLWIVAFDLFAQRLLEANSKEGSDEGINMPKELPLMRIVSIHQTIKEIAILHGNIQDELKASMSQTLTDVRLTINEKLRSLNACFDLFRELEPRLGIKQAKVLATLKLETTENKIDSTQFTVISSLSAVVSIVTLLSAVLLVFAWPRSDSNPGSTEDSDFWFLLQSSIMQLLGFFTALFPVSYYFAGAIRRWTMFFAIVGSICAVTAIPAYLHLPIFYTGLFSFIGTAAQAFIALQLSLLPFSHPKIIKKE